MYRIGNGFDIHKLIKGRPLVLGGVVIPSDKGEDAYSDGDVILHALTDAILGALHEGNIGQLFPDTDERYKNADSSLFVRTVVDHLVMHRGHINNVDITIQLEHIRLNPYVEEMENTIKALLHEVIDGDTTISVKPGTCEGMGDIGHGNAVCAYASVLLSLD